LLASLAAQVGLGLALPSPTLAAAGYALRAYAQAAVAEARGDALVASLDSAARAHVEHPTVAGASVAVVHRGRTLLRKGYGYVDLEWRVPTPEDGGASYQVLTDASYRAMISPAPLVDGTPVRYAMGLVADSTDGRRSIGHGGGIPGFLTEGRYYPDDDLIVVVLQNSTGPVGPAVLEDQLVELVLGPPEVEPAAAPYASSLDELAGRYAGPARGGPLTVTVSVADGELSVEPESGAARTPAYRGGLTWADGGLLLTFVREQGRVVALRWDTGGGHYVLRRQER
jgi:hypothetical protein